MTLRLSPNRLNTRRLHTRRISPQRLHTRRLSPHSRQPSFFGAGSLLLHKRQSRRCLRCSGFALRFLPRRFRPRRFDSRRFSPCRFSPCRFDSRRFRPRRFLLKGILAGCFRPCCGLFDGFLTLRLCPSKLCPGKLRPRGRQPNRVPLCGLLPFGLHLQRFLQRIEFGKFALGQILCTRRVYSASRRERSKCRKCRKRNR